MKARAGSIPASQPLVRGGTTCRAHRGPTVPRAALRLGTLVLSRRKAAIQERRSAVAKLLCCILWRCAHQHHSPIHRTAEKPAIRFISAPTRLSAYLRRETPQLAALKFLVSSKSRTQSEGKPAIHSSQIIFIDYGLRTRVVGIKSHEYCRVYCAAICTSGAAARTSASTWLSNCTKLSWNIATSLRAVSSNSALFCQVLWG